MFPWTELIPIAGALVSWEGIKYAITLKLSKRQQKQEVDLNEFNYVRQIAAQSSQSLIEMNEKLLTIIKESTNKSSQIDELSSSINNLNISNGKLKKDLETEKRNLIKIREFAVELVQCVEQYCECQTSDRLNRLRNEIRL